MTITAERIRELLAYDPHTGIFRWKVDRFRGKWKGNVVAKAGTLAGSVNAKGYLHIQIDGRKYPAHRLAWLYVTGEWPSDLIDHCDGDPSNNRWANLREATHAENNRNRRVSVNNRLGIKGVCRRGNKFRAQIRHEGNMLYLGSYDTPQEAAAMYAFASKDLHGKFGRHGND